MSDVLDILVSNGFSNVFLCSEVIVCYDVIIMLPIFCSCSATCCNKHREQNCDVLQPKSTTDNSEKSVNQISFPTADTVSLEKLELLSEYTKYECNLCYC